MKQVDYFKIIHKYIKPSSQAYPFYIIHVFQVANKAIRIAKRLKLSKKQIRFIEEAAMLHDIGIANVKTNTLFCNGELPYMHHITEGRKILETEGLPEHAQIAENHSGVGITKEEVVEHNLRIPAKDYQPETIEAKIISWADIFFQKAPDPWYERSIKEGREFVSKFGPEKVEIFNQWLDEFGK